MGKGKRPRKQKGKGVGETTQSEPSDILLGKGRVAREQITVPVVDVPEGHTKDVIATSDDPGKETGKGERGKGKRQHEGVISDASQGKRH